MAKGIAEATTKIYEQLLGLAVEERGRAVRAALTMLGQPESDVRATETETQKQEDTSGGGFSDKAKAWIKKHNIGASALEEMFHLDGDRVELILGKAIGKSRRQQTVNTYLLTGVAEFLATGNPEFTDEIAREYCQHLGCYDSPNHSNYVKAFGNKITGSKQTGWKLTAPGLAAAAELIGSVLGDDE